MADEKVYEPEVIQENPFPNEAVVPTVTPSQTQTKDTYSSTVVKDKPFKQKKVAHETIAQSLNTKSRKVLQEFDLVESGGFRVGNFKEGISGDLRITPSGLTARDQSGNTTFAIDGETGSAVFKGDIQAADFTVIDENGLVSLANFDTNSVRVQLLTISSGTYVDVTGTSLSFSLDRDTNILFLLNANCYLGTMNLTEPATGILALNVDGSLLGNMTLSLTDVMQYTSGYSNTESRRLTLSGNQLKTMSAGSHTIKVQGKILGASTQTLEITDLTLTYLILGR